MMPGRKVIVIGGGAAGLMAAGISALMDANTLIIEKMSRLGCKLAISGKGRCNLTNIAPLADFITHFGKNGRFLHQAFSRFFADDLMEFFKKLDVPIVTERGGRVFPKSQHAREVVDALTNWAKNCGAQIKTSLAVKQLLIEKNQILGIETHNNHKIYANAVIISTGGASYPRTGSTGDGYHFAESAGHTIIPIRPALVPLETGGGIAQRLKDLRLRNVSASLWIDGKKSAEEFGEMVFTSFGVTGPIILTLSKQFVDVLRRHKKTTLSLDLKPALDNKMLDNRLLRDFNTHGRRKFKTLLKELLPNLLIPICIEETNIDPEKPGNKITAEERKWLRKWLKNFSLEITGYRPLDEAIITAGGVNLKEVNPRTMESRLIKGLFFAGEVLDIDGDTGGYNLQAAFSTGWLAGCSAAEK